MHCNPQWSMRRVWKLLRTILQESALNSRQSELLLGAPGAHRGPCSLSGGYAMGPREEKWCPRKLKRGPEELGGATLPATGDLGHPGGLLGGSKLIPFGHLEGTRLGALYPESAKLLGQSDLLAQPTGGSCPTVL